MKRLFPIASFLFAAAFAVQADEIVLNNPSFESGTGGYWINIPSMARVDSAESSDGRKSLAVSPENRKTVSTVFSTKYRKNTVYELSFDAKTDLPGNAPSLTLSVMLQGEKPICFFDGSKEQKKKNSTPASLTEKWQTLKYTIGPVPQSMMNTDVRNLMFYLNIKQDTGNGKIWIDNFKLNAIAVDSQTEGGKTSAAPISFHFPKPVRIFETVPDLVVKGNVKNALLKVSATDAFGKKVFELKGAPGADSLNVRLPGPDYYFLTAELLRDNASVAKEETSLLITTPLPGDYYRTPEPAFGVWGGLDPEMRRLGGAKWDRQLFFTIFQKKDAKPLPPSPEKIASREPVKIIRCMNILNPFKRMVPVPAELREGLAKQLETEIVSKRGLVDVWETQNEPMVGENFHGTMNDVMDIIKLESGVVRKHDPGRPVAGICINPMSANQYAQYIGYYKNHSIGKYIDGVMLHPYIPGAQNPDASGYAETLNRLQKQLREISGSPVPMYISEIGYSTKPGGEISELQQAAYLARVVILNRTVPNLKACVWHIGLWNDATSRRELDFGLLRKHAKESAVREPKPAFAAWATVSRMTYDAELVKELNIGRKLRVWLFNKRGTPLLIAYSLLAEPVELRIVMNSPEVTLTQVCGKSEKVKLPDGILTLRLTEAPVYITGGNLKEFTDSKFNAVFSPDPLFIAPGETRDVQIDLPEGLASANSVLKLQSDLPMENRIAGNGKKWNVAITVPEKVQPREYDLFVRLEENGSGKYIWQKTITVRPPAELVDVKALPEGSEPGIAFSVRKNSTLPDDAFVLEILENKNVVSISKLEKQTSGTAVLLNTTQGRKNVYSARFTDRRGFKWEQKLPSDIVPVKIPFLKNALQVPLSSWPSASRYELADGTPSVHGLKGKFDLPAGSIHLSYDDTFLYFALDVKDQDFLPEKNAASLWNGDSLQIGVSVPQKHMIRPNNDGIQETSYAEFGVKADGKSPDSHVWASMNLNLMPLNQAVPGIKMRNSYENGIIHYRFAVPWKTLNIKPSKGLPLGLSILVNDRDPAGRHWVEWFSGIANGKDPFSYGSAVLR